MQIGSVTLNDIRAQLPRADWSVDRRRGLPSGAVLHYNGPAVPAERQSGQGLLDQLIADAIWHMRLGTLGPNVRGDGLQYHIAVASDGQLSWCRDLDTMLWHCGASQNGTHLAIHLPIGAAQRPSSPMWAATTALLDALAEQYDWPSRRVVLGHQECSATTCPGKPIMELLTACRAQLPDPWSAWGLAFPLPVEQRGFAIPRYWMERRAALGAAASDELWLNETTAVRDFERGTIIYHLPSTMCYHALH